MAETIEHNEIRHVGVKPAVDQDSIRMYSKMPDFATEVTAIDNVALGTNDWYTVPAGKTLYLTTFVLSASNTLGGITDGYSMIRTSAPADYFCFFSGVMPRTFILLQSYPFNPPLPIPENYYFRHYSNHGQLLIYGSLYGFLV